MMAVIAVTVKIEVSMMMVRRPGILKRAYILLFYPFYVHILLSLWHIVTVVPVYRHQFYLHARLDLQEGRLRVKDWNITPKFIALMVQAECGDFDPLASPQLHSAYLKQCSQLCTEEDIKPPDVLHRVCMEHQELKVSLYSIHDMSLLIECA
jgi:hypothetical protein